MACISLTCNTRESVSGDQRRAYDGFDALEKVLPIRNGIAKFYCEKSKSFTSLSSIKDIATRILVAIAEATKGHIVMKCCSNKTLGFPFTASLRIINQDCLHTMRDITEKALHGNSGESSSRNWLLNPLNAAQSSTSNSTMMPFNGGQSSRLNQMMISSNAKSEGSYRNQTIPFIASRHSSSNPIVMPFNGGPSSGYNQMMIPLNANAAESSSRNQIMMPLNGGRRSVSNPNVMPFNCRRRSGSNEMMMSRYFHESIIHNFSNMRVGRNAFPRNNQLINEVLPEDRTMFVTFSRGYPVAEMEVRHFFATVYGNCIESFRMQEGGPYEQPLYAWVVFRKASFIEEILNGAEKAKFTMNGMHIWMRKFVPRNEGSS
ncbi:unnamed protein product [Fraxinus pennsylvanica]|uniref:Uncharacterized protein n=1 Tax=Fraxinus pennsylvanica TaxID=56036 RepID=A0AAD1ZFB3_9LAMI|nr:unnamed protein product [Fraxinus pennsylvanica]